MGSNLGEILRAKLAAQQFNNDTQPQQPQQPQPAHRQTPGKVTNNINRATFAQVRDFPATRKEVVAALEARGYKGASASAVIGMMLRQGLAMADSNGVLHATVKEYVPLKNSRALERELKRAKAQPRKKVAVVRRPKAEEKAEEKRPVSISSPARVWSVDDVLNQLSVVQARELLDALKNLFGEIK